METRYPKNQVSNSISAMSISNRRRVSSKPISIMDSPTSSERRNSPGISGSHLTHPCNPFNHSTSNPRRPIFEIQEVPTTEEESIHPLKYIQLSHDQPSKDALPNEYGCWGVSILIPSITSEVAIQFDDCMDRGIGRKLQYPISIPDQFERKRERVHHRTAYDSRSSWVLGYMSTESAPRFDLH